MSPHDTAAGAGEPPTKPIGSAWTVQIDRAMDRLVGSSHVASPDEVPELVRAAAACFDGGDAVVYLADLQQRVLVPFHDVRSQHDQSPQLLGIDSTVAGRAFAQMLRQTQSTTSSGDAQPNRVQVWMPLVDGTERLGVLGVTLPTPKLDDDTGMRRLHRFASVVAELLVTKTLYGDTIVRVRRTSQLSLASEVQWSLLPPLTFATRSVTIAGALEPAYEVAGDSLDYAVDAGVARFAVFDGMGHGLVSAQLISLVVAAYRNARRSGQSLVETAEHIETAVNHVFHVEQFATGVLCELDTTTGLLRWISAGHHEPLLLREGRLVRTLRVDPMLPLGINQNLGDDRGPVVGTESLQPGDCLLLYTDGVIEARSPSGTFFGKDQLVDLIVRSLAAGLPAPETMRRATHELLKHQAGNLDDDATLLLVEWHGPTGTDDDSALLSVTGRRAVNPFEAVH